MFSESWKRLLLDRNLMSAVAETDPFEALNNIWFYAGLFHDTCSCIEKNILVVSHYNKLFEKFKGIDLQDYNIESIKYDHLLSNSNEYIKQIGGELHGHTYPIIERSIQHNKPDHGFLGAIYLIKKITSETQKYFSREAARGILLHNIMGNVDHDIDKVLSWETDPIACLLALCDQLQTWDRERGDEKSSNDSDLPVRAELLDLKIKESSKDSFSISIAINYITRRHVDKNTVIRGRVERKLKKILHDNPYKALDKIKSPWPFELYSKFYVNRHYLTELNF